MSILKKSLRRGVVSRHCGFSAHAENHPGSGTEKWCWWKNGPYWCRMAPMWARLALAGNNSGLLGAVTLLGCLLFPRIPLGFCWPPLPHQAPVLWALFPITLPTQCLPPQGRARAESAAILLWKLERHSGAETWGLHTHGENHALPLLFIPFLGWRILNTVDPRNVALINWLWFTLGCFAFFINMIRKQEAPGWS